MPGSVFVVLVLFATHASASNTIDQRPGFMGVGLSDSQRPAGALIIRVVPQSPADKAGLAVRDIVQSINGDAVSDAADLMEQCGKLSPGTLTTLKVWRFGVVQEINVRMGERPK